MNVRVRLFGITAALGVAALASAGNAQAQCAWNGYNWSCGAPPAYAAPYAAPYAYPGYYPYYGYSGGPYGYGYNTGWSSAYPGPRASGH